jgi:hypothetical protein
MEEVIIVQANKRVTGMQVSFWEFLQFLSCGSTGAPCSVFGAATIGVQS